MVKFLSRKTKSGRPLVGLGLTEENIKRMQEGKPILINLAEIENIADLDIFIFVGKDEMIMLEDITKTFAVGEVKYNGGESRNKN